MGFTKETLDFNGKTEAEIINILEEYNIPLTPEEIIKIQNDFLARAPSVAECVLFSIEGSEHCSYKNSILWLKTLPKEGKHMLVQAGEENAGLVDIGDGLACAFKIESHNHPSALEPYQGAATGAVSYTHLTLPTIYSV